jgi:KRAB domain-containing zinc finger protein
MKRKNSKIEDFFKTKRIKVEENLEFQDLFALKMENFIDEAENMKHILQNICVVKLKRLTEEEIEEATKWKRKTDDLKSIPCGKISSKKNFNCKKCKQKVSTKEGLENHICSFCSICAKFFSKQYVLRQHQRAYHNKELKLDKFTCDLCAKEYGSYRAIVRHIAEVHSSFEFKFKCESHCERTFRTSQAYQNHLRLSKKKKCKICQKEVTFLSQHMKITHGTNERPHECLVCSKRFKRKFSLKIHEGSHDKKFQCEICQWKFATNAQLKDHLKLHENPDLFQCKICLRSFTTKNSLRYHLTTHDKNRVKEFRCEKCNYSTDLRNHLKTHQKYHERQDRKLKWNPKAVKCPQCPLVMYKKSLKYHIQTMHEKKFQVACDLCGKLFSTKYSLSVHLKSKHFK